MSGDGPGGVVVHFGPDLREPGGIAQVVHSYLEADLQPWTVDFVSIYTNVARVRQLWRLLASVTVLATRRRHRMAGIHVHTSNGFDLIRTLLLLEIAHRRGLPAVVTIHGSRFMKEVRRAPRLVRAILARASAVTVLTDEVRTALLDLGAEAVCLLPNPVRLRSPAARIEDRRHVLFAGEIGYRKGVDVLLDAWPAVQREHPDSSLLLVGPVAQPALVESLPAGVRLAGSLPHRAVLDALQTSGLAVLPSRAEAMPMFVLEAMAAGVPVVATRVGAVEAIVGDAGVVVPANDSEELAAAINNLLQDPARMSEMSRNGQRRVSENFSAAIFSHKVSALYTKVFGP